MPLLRERCSARRAATLSCRRAPAAAAPAPALGPARGLAPNAAHTPCRFCASAAAHAGRTGVRAGSAGRLVNARGRTAGRGVCPLPALAEGAARCPAQRWPRGLPTARDGRGGCPLPALRTAPSASAALGRALGLARRVLGRTRRIPRAAPSAPPPSCWPTLKRGLKLDGIAMPFSSQFFCEPVQFTTRGHMGPSLRLRTGAFWGKLFELGPLGPYVGIGDHLLGKRPPNVRSP